MSTIESLAKSGESRSASGLRVVVIDDEDDVRRAVIAQLRHLCCDAFALDPSEELIARIGEISPAIIVLDLSLGRTDAIEVLRDLAETSFSGAILLLSGRNEQILQSAQTIGIRLGLKMLGPLRKPLRLHDLRLALDAPHVQVHTAEARPSFEVGDALREGWLEVWYQPKVSTEARQLLGAEALVRLRHPTHGVVEPGAFLPPAGTDAYEAMTAFIVDQVARDHRDHFSPCPLPSLSINASIRMIERPAFLDMIRSAWPVTETRPNLTVEITEDEVITDLTLAQEVATQLALYDVSIAIDDFGAGFSSFSTLTSLPFSELKLDRSFVSGCADSERKVAFCRSIALLARQLGVLSVAEGIETLEEFETVRAAGFDQAQGYLLGRPATPDAFRATHLAS